MPPEPLKVNVPSEATDRLTAHVGKHPKTAWNDVPEDVDSSSAETLGSTSCGSLWGAAQIQAVQKQLRHAQPGVRRRDTRPVVSATTPSHSAPAHPETPQEWLEVMRKNLFGRKTLMPTPLGWRAGLYCDFTASGRALKHIEHYIASMVQPCHANTHTVDSFSGRTMTDLYHQALLIIKECMRADPKEFLLFATGSGCTGALKRLQEILGVRVLDSTFRRMSGRDVAVLDGADEAEFEQHILETKTRLRAQDRLPLVFIGPAEHHSNDLSWRFSVCDVVRIRMDHTGHFDTKELEAKLKEARAASPKREIYVSFSAASNVTGVCAPVTEVCRIAHEHGALAFCDYAAGAPYLAFDQSVPHCPDAIVFSGHKFAGAPNTPGILLLRTKVYKLGVPTYQAGGTVNSVSHENVDFNMVPEERERDGTPDAIGLLRLALAMQNKARVQPLIDEIEHEHVKDMLAFFDANKQLTLMNSAAKEGRLAIFSFVVRDVDGYIVSSALVARLLGDLFGICARAGCNCSGPQGLDMYGITQAAYDAALRPWLCGKDAANVMKPGWTRLNLHYTVDAEGRQYVKDAILFIAANAHKLQLLYEIDLMSGEWHPRLQDGTTGVLTQASRIGSSSFGIEQSVNFVQLEVCSDQRYRQLRRNQLGGARKLVRAIDRQLRKLRIDPSARLPDELFTRLPAMEQAFARMAACSPCARRSTFSQGLACIVGLGYRFAAVRNLEAFDAKARKALAHRPATNTVYGRVLSF